MYVLNQMTSKICLRPVLQPLTCSPCLYSLCPSNPSLILLHGRSFIQKPLVGLGYYLGYKKKSFSTWRLKLSTIRLLLSLMSYYSPLHNLCCSQMRPIVVPWIKCSVSCLSEFIHALTIPHLSESLPCLKAQLRKHFLSQACFHYWYYFGSFFSQITLYYVYLYTCHILSVK